MIADILGLRDISQEKLANELKVPAGTFSTWATGKVTVRRANAEKVRQAWIKAKRANQQTDRAPDEFKAKITGALAYINDVGTLRRVYEILAPAAAKQILAEFPEVRDEAIDMIVERGG